MRRALLLVALAACPGSPKPPETSSGKAVPRTAQGLLAAANVFSNVRHEFILDPTSSFAPGRGVQKTAEGIWEPVPTACARGKASAESRVDTQTIDFGFVGVAVDTVLVGADADITPFFSAGGEASTHTIRLVAMAFVRDLDPQFFEASDDVASGPEGCACARATHFVGAVKMGALLAYETNARAGEVHGKAIDFVKLKLAARDATVKETRAGTLEIDGLDAVEAGQVRPLSFRVKQAVPIAYAVYPISDVCKFAFPEPDVSPALVDFGDVPYGAESTRMLHIVNRAQVDLYAIHEARNFAVPARGSVDLPITWRPRGDSTGCDAQTREETVLFVPRDSAVATVPAQQSVRVVEHVRAGKPAVRQSEHVDTGEHRKPDYAKTAREWQCPNDYAVESCKTEHAACADKSGACTADGYGLSAQMSGNGCKFACSGPDALVTSQFCRFDAVMDCRLRCAK